MRSLIFSMLTGVSLLTVATTANAQAAGSGTTASEGVNDANEIIVSARRRDESVQDVPQTVNVVTAAQVEKLNLRNFTDIASVVPGLQLSSTSAFDNVASVRGISFVPAASGNNPSVEFYLNDAPISSAFLFQSTYDFGQFELQRGPQGTLRGRASPSGSIAVTTRRPDLSEVGMVMNATATDRHAYKLDGAFNIPIIRDMLAVRVAGVIDENRGNGVRSVSETVNPTLSKKPYSKTQSIRASVRFEPTDWVSFNFMYQNLHSEKHDYQQLVSESLINPAAPAATTQIIRPFDRLGVDEQGQYNRQDQEVFVLNTDIRFAGQKLSYVGAYNKNDFGVLAPQDAANFFTTPRVATLARRTVADLGGFDQVCQNEVKSQNGILSNGAYDQCTHSHPTRQSHELRLASDERIAGIFDYVIGGFYDHNKTPSNLTQETPVLFSAGGAPGLVNLTSIVNRGKSTEKSAFGNLTAHLLDDKLELSGGLRYIDYRTEGQLYQSSRQGTLQCAEVTNTAQRCLLSASNKAHWHSTVYLASVKYKITPDIMAYAMTGSSWRPGPRAVGNFSAGPGGLGQTARELSFENLQPEKSKSYEIGLKTSFLNGRGHFNIAAYHQTFDNYPFRGPQVFYLSTNSSGTVSVATANNPGGFGFLSPSHVTVNGVEAEASYLPLENWTIGLNASYADGKIKNATIACTDLNGDGIPDINAPRPTVADLQAAVGAGQTMSQCSGVNGPSSEQPKFSANVQSEYDFDISGNMGGFLRGLYSFYGKTGASQYNSFDDVGAYGLLNLYAGLRGKDGNWELSIFGKNITAEKKVLTVSGSVTSTSYQLGATGLNANSQYRNITVTAPREFGVNLRVALGSR